MISANREDADPSEQSLGFMDLLGCEFDPEDRNEFLELLTQRIAQLPRIPKKILALYYYENLGSVEIANGIGLTGNEVEQIRADTLRLLRNELAGDIEQSDRAA